KEDDFGRFEIYSGVKSYIGDSLNSIEINNSSISQTSLPLNQREYWDCPGFEDSRGYEQNIINAYSIYALTKSIKNIKVLVVVSENTIIERRLCLVITQNKRLDLKKVRNRLCKTLIERDNLESFSLSQRKILNFLSSDRSQIAFFNAPCKEGLIPDTDKFEILDCIEKISYIENLVPSFSLRPDVNSQQFKDKLRQVLSIIQLLRRDDLKDELQKKISQLNFINLIKTESIIIQGNTSSWYHLISELINAIKSLTYEPKINNEGQLLTFEGTIIGIEDVAKSISHTTDYKEINVYSLNTIFIDKDIEAPGAFLTFISPQLRVVGKRTINLKGKAGPSHNPRKAENGTNKIINKQDTYNIINENDTKNEINEEADRRNNQDKYDIINENDTKNEINEEAVNKIITDVKIEETINEATNGKDVCDRINNDNIKKASLEMHGKDGLPGLPGCNGGHFYVKGRNFINLSSLTIDISGGDGGRGQDGGDGAEGQDGDYSKKKETVDSRKETALVLRGKVSGTKIEKGQEGGNGGREGVGGNIGSRKGIDGKEGSPGRGGKFVEYRGVYINEIVFSVFRGYKEFDARSIEKLNRIVTTTGVSTVTGLTTATGNILAAQAMLKTVTISAAKLVGKNVILLSPTAIASIFASMGISLAIPAVMSPISAVLSSHWKIEPHKVNDSKFAPDGKSPSSPNNEKIQIMIDSKKIP
ncbi:16437_t:CDS:2, partial [Dentiscutata erythropus]